jgi:hypothetical protein
VDPETWRIAAVRAGPDRRLVVTWKGGAESIVDVAQHLDKYAIFTPLRTDGDRFRRVMPGEWGWCAHWSDDMEIAADTLHRLALDQGSAWLRAWRTAHRMTEAEAARALGISSRLWRCYESGSRLLPKTVRLAGIGLDAEAKAA